MFKCCGFIGFLLLFQSCSVGVGGAVGVGGGTGYGTGVGVGASIPIGGSGYDYANTYEVIIQTNSEYLSKLAKDYRKLHFTYVKTLSDRAGMYLITINTGDEDPEWVLSKLRQDVRITEAEFNKPLIRR